MHRAQHFLRIQPRTHYLADLGQQLELLGPPRRILHEHAVFQRHAQLPRFRGEQPQLRRAKTVPTVVWRQHQPKVIFPGLQRHHREPADFLFGQQLPQPRRPVVGEFSGLELVQMAERKLLFAAGQQVAQVFRALRLAQVVEEIRREPAHRARQHSPPGISHPKRAPL